MRTHSYRSGQVYARPALLIFLVLLVAFLAVAWAPPLLWPSQTPTLLCRR